MSRAFFNLFHCYSRSEYLYSATCYLHISFIRLTSQINRTHLNEHYMVLTPEMKDVQKTCTHISSAMCDAIIYWAQTHEDLSGLIRVRDCLLVACSRISNSLSLTLNGYHRIRVVYSFEHAKSWTFNFIVYGCINENSVEQHILTQSKDKSA